MPRLADYDLGDVDAEKDSNVLFSQTDGAFYRTGSFVSLLRGGKRVYVGRKGAGKTALRLALAHYAKAMNQLSVHLSLQQFSTKNLGKKLDHLADHSDFDLTHFMRNTWRVALGCAAMSAYVCSQHASSAGGDTDAYQSILRGGGGRPRAVNDKLQFSLYDTFVSAVENLPDVLASPRSPTEKLRYPVSDQYLDAEAMFIARLGPELSTHITVDDLDDTYDRFPDVLCPLVTGLVDAIRELQAAYPGNDAFVIRAFIPKDAFKPSTYRDWDQASEILQSVEWNEQDLRIFLARRIRRTLGRVQNLPPSITDESAARSTLLHVLPDRVYDPWGGTRDPFSWLLCFTQKRPRDVLELVKRLIAAVNQKDPDCTRFEPTHFLSLLPEVSRGIAGSVVGEYKERFPGVASVLQAFDGIPAEISSEKALSIIRTVVTATDLTAQQWLNALYEIGFIGKVIQVSATGDFLYPYDAAQFSFDQDVVQDLSGPRLVIHRLFWEYRNLFATRWAFRYPD